MPVSRSSAMPSPGRIRLRRSVGALGAVALALVLLPLAAPARAADGPAMTAQVMLDGHARIGGWMAISVRVRNEGPDVVGELRLAGGTQGRTRFATPVDLPTHSDKTFQLYAQPPAFGTKLDVTLWSANRTIATQSVAFRVHEMNQLVVGVVAEKPQAIVSKVDLLPDARGTKPAIVPLQPDDLPERVEAWAPLDRLVWQDADSTLLRPEQIAALRGWLAAGGRLVLVGGTTGPAALSAFPDDILPFRPSSTIDAAPESLAGLIDAAPAGASDVPALSGELARGRALATSGGRAIAAEAAYGAGAVSIVGFDPAAGWIGESKSVTGLWRRLLPPRTSSVTSSTDDNQLVQAVSQLPSLALPPIGGLLLLLGGYILLVGPINYAILRRLDRREWAWVTMPVLIVLFAAGAYAFGTALRGLDVIVNEVAIVRGAGGATEGTAQVYLGVFSPSRSTYQVDVPGGALLSSTITGDFTGAETAALDILQGDPARLRDLTIPFGSLRTVRAETAASVPRIDAELRLDKGTLSGRIRNASEQTLERPAIALGGSVVVLNDLAPGSEQTVSLPIRSNQFGQSLSDRILGQVFYDTAGRLSEKSQRTMIRHAVIDQLTFDPNFGTTAQLDTESPVLLAWGTGDILDVRIQGQVPRRTGNVLYFIPLRMAVTGPTTFTADLVRSIPVETDALFFSKDPYSINFGQGSVTIAYRPITFDGTLSATRLLLGMNWSGSDPTSGGANPIEPEPSTTPGSAEPSPEPAPTCDPNTEPCKGFDGIPDVEVFDRRGTGTWQRLPHFTMSTVYELKDPERYVEPATGAVLVRFVNERQDPVSFTFQVTIEGQVR